MFRIQHEPNKMIYLASQSLQIDKAVSAYFARKQILPFGFVRQNSSGDETGSMSLNS